MNKQAPTHFLVIPKEPITQLSSCTPSHEKVDWMNYGFKNIETCFYLVAGSFITCCCSSC